MDSINISVKQLGTEIPEIGRGDEGTVYNYDNKYAIKLFSRLKEPGKESRFKRKMTKVEAMTSLRDPNCAFPLGLVYLDRDLYGYYTQLIQSEHKDYSYLMELKSLREILEYLKKGDQVLQRIHKLGLSVGDIREANILLNTEDEPVYIDTDNYLYKGYPFDLVPDRAGVFYGLYGKSREFQDNDILVYTIMCLKMITRNKHIDPFNQREFYETIIENLPFGEEVKKELRRIFSPEVNKPYFTQVLQKMNR